MVAVLSILDICGGPSSEPLFITLQWKIQALIQITSTLQTCAMLIEIVLLFLPTNRHKKIKKPEVNFIMKRYF